MFESPIWTLLVEKVGYSACGGVGAILAVAIATPTFRLALVRLGVGVSVCFLAAEPLRAYYTLAADPHTQIGVNGVLGFASWYVLVGLDRVVRNLTDEQNLMGLLKSWLKLNVPPGQNPTPTPPPP